MGSKFEGTWEDPGGDFFEFAVKRALKQDQIVHMEGILQVIPYFSRECFNLWKNSRQKIDIMLSALYVIALLYTYTFIWRWNSLRSWSHNHFSWRNHHSSTFTDWSIFE